MTEPAWYWADHDGTPKATTVAALRATLSLSALPPFVLVWLTGLSEWLPAYLARRTIAEEVTLQHPVVDVGVEADHVVFLRANEKWLLRQDGGLSPD